MLADFVTDLLILLVSMLLTWLQVYVVEVTVGLCSWIVKHRYSEFRELHEKVGPVVLYPLGV